MTIYIDTHVACWLHMGDKNKFTDNVLNLIEKNEVKISPMVSLELQYLYEIKRLAVKPNRLLEILRLDFKIKECDAEFAMISQFARKINWTRDPFDRIITAQAMLFNAKLLTKDNTILKNYKNAVW